MSREVTAFAVGDLVRIPANSQLLEFNLDASKTIRGHDTTVQAQLATNEPILGLVFRVGAEDVRPRYLGVMVENRRWFVDDKYVSKVNHDKTD